MSKGYFSLEITKSTCLFFKFYFIILKVVEYILYICNCVSFILSLYEYFHSVSRFVTLGISVGKPGDLTCSWV